MLLVNLYAGDDLIAAVAGARRVERKEEAPELWRMVENLSITAGLPMPRCSSSRMRARTRSPPAGRRSRRSWGHNRAAGAARRGGAGGGARPRDEPHPQLRRAPDDLGGRAGGLDRAAGEVFTRGDVVRRRRPGRRRQQPDRADRRWSRPGAGAGRGDPDPDGDQPPAGVRRRRVGRGADPLPAGPGVGAAARSRRRHKPSPRLGNQAIAH